MLAATKEKVWGSDKNRKTYNIRHWNVWLESFWKFLKQIYKKGAARA